MSKEAKSWLWILAIVAAMVLLAIWNKSTALPPSYEYETGCEGSYDRDGTPEC